MSPTDPAIRARYLSCPVVRVAKNRLSGADCDRDSPGGEVVVGRASGSGRILHARLRPLVTGRHVTVIIAAGLS